MWESISKLIGANSTAVLVITIIGTFSVWLYKEFRTMNKEDFKSRIALINKKIEMYSKLEAAIAAVLNQKDTTQAKSNLYEKFGEYSPFFSDDVRRIMRDYYKQNDNGYLYSLLAFTEVEVKLLENEKHSLSANDSSTDVMDAIRRLIRPLSPIMMIWLFTVFMLFFYSNFMREQDLFSRLVIVIMFFSCFFSLILIFVLVSLGMDNNLRKLGWRRWLYIVGISMVPWAEVIFTDLALLFVGIQAFSLFMFIREKKRKTVNIILIK
ncbi:hypothetical protein [Cohnella thailandensis]|uniref:Uncharacterized protein n=1 Tax=Cohnella thailandensis TaxID=557557 RepID=A0A841SZJ9_9BACL|nr:hypothetical protein [Cohnella thailandensis]MBB6637613.1 hypothetical protein [Cohnella thailandensis]MBP1974211.1 hypothetical protein [Cohnella thailandensis]